MGEYGRTFTSRPVGTVMSTHTSGELLLSTRQAVVLGSIDDTGKPWVCEISIGVSGGPLVRFASTGSRKDTEASTMGAAR